MYDRIEYEGIFFFFLLQDIKFNYTKKVLLVAS
jgi:hypothetical protein